MNRKVVVITGASAGIGRATAVAYARRGWRIALLARGEERLEAARREVEDAGGEALVATTDVADATQVERAAARVEREWGAIDVWINNAMVSVFSPVAEMAPDEYRRVTEVTYLGAVHGTLAALARMRTRNRGTIVQVGSALAYRGIPIQSAYCAAKHALKGFTESLLCELRHERSAVRVTMVHLPAVNTPQFDWVRSRLPRRARPMGRVFQPEPIAEEIVLAAERGAREVFLGGPTLKVVWGEIFVPGWIDRYLGRVGHDGQQTVEPEPAGRPDNLFRPAPGDRGAHGRFDEEARPYRAEVRLTAHRRWAMAGLAAVAAVLGAAVRHRRGAGTIERRPEAAHR
jgi:NAD(P)-dependent dehydrogenase (short-subunit alcohol dehydrogenase family)